MGVPWDGKGLRLTLVSCTLQGEAHSYAAHCLFEMMNSTSCFTRDSLWVCRTGHDPMEEKNSPQGVVTMCGMRHSVEHAGSDSHSDSCAQCTQPGVPPCFMSVVADGELTLISVGDAGTGWAGCVAKEVAARCQLEMLSAYTGAWLKRWRFSVSLDGHGDAGSEPSG